MAKRNQEALKWLPDDDRQPEEARCGREPELSQLNEIYDKLIVSIHTDRIAVGRHSTVKMQPVLWF